MKNGVGQFGSWMAQLVDHKEIANFYALNLKVHKHTHVERAKIYKIDYLSQHYDYLTKES